MRFYPELLKFLAQSKTNVLGTSQFETQYLGLKVKVSFGKGRQALVPWIAFLGGDDSIPKGIYPVYLFFKEKHLLILAYGVSETNQPLNGWKISNPQSLESYFADRNLGSIKRYGSSYFFNAYDTNQSLNEVEIDRDLAKLIDIYKQQ